ncbi:MAG: biotin--[acetyl-CoA-carboxylase] ligase [Proteobacteria bacterium]|nr:MAG: biotin--[acetyl-CoA-carboxylase] ligase [Pseudomonadota bacterium]
MNEPAARVLAALRRAGAAPISGESLSAALGVSRAQVWKHVESLRAAGYDVTGEPGGGYRLAASPDRLYPEEVSPRLHTRWLARRYHWLDDTDSTNRVAAELAREGAPHGTTVVAEGQSAGRGRLGRRFFSPPYLNLYTSIVLRPRLDTARAPTAILAAAVAVAETVEAFVPEPAAVEIKWPNDVLLGGLKTSGILMEMGAEATRVAHLVLGIGVNLNVARDAFPDDFRALATSVSTHCGARVDRVGFAARLYDTLEDVLDRHAAGGFDAVRPRFEARFRMRGKTVRVLDSAAGGATNGAGGAPVVEGVAAGIDADGALLVERADGSRERVVAGDVTIAKQPRPEEKRS